jgi:putative Holliday junction resolvase
LLGFDFGTRRIGVAVGQEVTGTARPLTTLLTPNGAIDWTALGRLIEDWRADAFVVGLPVHMDGTEHDLTRAARRFGNRLAGRYNRPVFFVDERLSSDEAERQLADQVPKGGRAGRSHKQAIDAVAAQIILQSWLDHHTP